MGLQDFILNCEKDSKQLRKDIQYYKNKSQRLQQENQKLKEVIDKAINYIEWHSKFIFGKAERRFSDGKLECADGVEVFTGSPTKLLDILKEVE